MTFAAAQPVPQQQLPPGSAVVFVCDGRLDVGAKAGASTRVRLRDALLLDGAVVAAAGTPARLVLGGVSTAPGGRRAIVSIEDFRTRYGLLPVRASATLPAIEPGVVVPAITLARVAHLGDRYAIEVPFPFKLTTEQPVSTYTATPPRTPGPSPSALPRRGRSAPSPSPSPELTPSAAPTMNPLR